MAFCQAYLSNKLTMYNCNKLCQYILMLIYWTKFITQLVTDPISVCLCGGGHSFWDILLNYSQWIFGAPWVAPLQHGSLTSNLVGKNAFFGSQALTKRLKLFNILYSNVRSIRWGLSLENPLLKFHTNSTSNFSSLRFERLLPECPYNAMQNRYHDNF